MRCRNPFAFKPGPVSFWTTVIYLAVAIPLLYVHETVPSAPPSDSSLYGALNLTEAWLDLQTISNAYHPYNSHQNDVVRDYILRRSRDILQRNGVPYVEELLGGALRDQRSADVHGMACLQNPPTDKLSILASTMPFPITSLQPHRRQQFRQSPAPQKSSSLMTRSPTSPGRTMRVSSSVPA